MFSFEKSISSAKLLVVSLSPAATRVYFEGVGNIEILQFYCSKKKSCKDSFQKLAICVQNAFVCVLSLSRYTVCRITYDISDITAGVLSSLLLIIAKGLFPRNAFDDDDVSAMPKEELWNELPCHIIVPAWGNVGMDDEEEEVMDANEDAGRLPASSVFRAPGGRRPRAGICGI